MEFIKSEIMETIRGYANETGLKVGKKNNYGRNSCFKNYSKVRQVKTSFHIYLFYPLVHYIITH